MFYKHFILTAKQRMDYDTPFLDDKQKEMKLGHWSCDSFSCKQQKLLLK